MIKEIIALPTWLVIRGIQISGMLAKEHALYSKHIPLEQWVMYRTDLAVMFDLAIYGSLVIIAIGAIRLWG